MPNAGRMAVGLSWQRASSSRNSRAIAGENVSPAIAREFLELLARCQLKPTAIRPAFGMAEMGSGVTYRCATDTEPLRVFYARRDSLSGAVVQVTAKDADAVGLVSLGPPIPGIELRIVNDQGQSVQEGHVGI